MHDETVLWIWVRLAVKSYNCISRPWIIDSKREIPKLNRHNFPAWKSLMKLHLGGLGDHEQSTITNDHVDPARALTTGDLKSCICTYGP